MIKSLYLAPYLPYRVGMLIIFKNNILVIITSKSGQKIVLSLKYSIQFRVTNDQSLINNHSLDDTESFINLKMFP